MVFNRLKKALKKFVDNVAEVVATKTISEKDLEPILEELVIGLAESDVAFEVAEEIAEKLRQRLVGAKIPRTKDLRDYVIESLREVLIEILRRGYKPVDLLGEARSRSPENPLKIVFFGVNGVGKTTTIAKFAYMFKRGGVTPVIVAADTFRAGAQEQLRRHAEKLGVPFIGGRYGADPASVVYDGIEYARARGYRVVLADTAGRMHTDTDLMEELRKIVRVAKPDYKALVVLGEAEGIYYAVYAWLRRTSPGQMARAVYDAYERFRPLVIGAEENALGDFLYTPFDEEARQRGYALPLRGIHHASQKRARVERLSPLVERGKIRFLTGASAGDMRLLVEQLLSFPEGSFIRNVNLSNL